MTKGNENFSGFLREYGIDLNILSKGAQDNIIPTADKPHY